MAVREARGYRAGSRRDADPDRHQPTGLQVDQDVEGACARWQLAHPADSVWIEVNRTAVPECTGPNRKPTVAQFCTFAVLPDGRRVKTANSVNNPYCEELFVEWLRERVS